MNEETFPNVPKLVGNELLVFLFTWDTYQGMEWNGTQCTLHA
jgi:hypothetical protein